ncbi:hypothetical protein PoB_003663200 [Plakobranchus ocellatus]|uniref:Uncharacterized protein n=1 Tax=Plakobranchus ocellatus TaxID=259542 RepID=A0AAV4AT85_9GAST|nr:hypothetical protein PoB_003663200 [Plakobranchus ocellatus]
MEDHEEKVEQERRRQLDLMTSRSEQRRLARMTPQPFPTPGAATRPSLILSLEEMQQIYNSDQLRDFISPLSGSPGVLSLVSALSTKDRQMEKKSGQLPTFTTMPMSWPPQAFLAKFRRRMDDFNPMSLH